MVVKIALSSSVSKSAKESKPSNCARSDANASFVGAKTVNGPLELKVPIKSVPSELSAVLRAETKDDKASWPLLLS